MAGLHRPQDTEYLERDNLPPTPRRPYYGLKTTVHPPQSGNVLKRNILLSKRRVAFTTNASSRGTKRVSENGFNYVLPKKRRKCDAKTVVHASQGVAGVGRCILPSKRRVAICAKAALLRVKHNAETAVGYVVPVKQGLTVDPRTKGTPVKQDHSQISSAANSPVSAKLTFTIVQLTLLPAVQVCYGCGTKFSQKYKSEPNNLILKTFCRRRYRDKSGVEKISAKVTAAYSHLKMSCVTKI